MHTRLLDRLPSAIVTANGSEKKVYEDNSVFFNKGDNFELRFFNPLQIKLGIEIIFNGQKKGNGLLVLNPGEDIKLDRFLDDKKKMLFDTYNIDTNNEAAVQAAAQNGIININFYKERTQSYHHHDNTGNFFDMNAIGNTSSRVYNSPGTFTSGADFSYMSESFDNTTLGNNATLDSLSSSFSDENSRGVNLNETGRVEKGDESNQNLKQVEIEFESAPFHSVQYYLKPLSTKTYKTTEIRNYCTKCQYRLRKTTWDFCPKCGEKII